MSYETYMITGFATSSYTGLTLLILAWYFLIAFLIYFFSKNGFIKGGNSATQFWIENKFKGKEFKLYVSIFWLPILIWVLFIQKRG